MHSLPPPRFLSSHLSMFERLPLTGESAVGSLLIIQPQRGRVTEGDALIVIGHFWTPAPPTCKRGAKVKQEQPGTAGGRGGSGAGRVGGAGEGGWRVEVGHAGTGGVK